MPQTAPTITWAPGEINYGTLLSSAQLNASANVSGVFTYTPSIGVKLPTGSNTLSVQFVPTDTTDYETVTVTTSIFVNYTVPSLTWANPRTIYSGTSLSTEQLNASASVPGTYTYNPPIGTVLPLGTSTLECTFVPTDPGYSTVTHTVSITVLLAIVSLTISPSVCYLELDDTQIYNVIASYSDGTMADVTNVVTWACQVGSFLGNIYTPSRLGNDTLRATLSGVTTTLVIDVLPVDSLTVSKPNISYLTQDMLNYFDQADRRVRTNRVSIDSQLLNLGGQLLEDLELRVNREQARNLRNVPTNIDNNGCYFAIPIPNTITIDPNNPYFMSVTGTINSQPVTYKPFDDKLGIPSGIVLDSNRSAFPIANPVLFTTSGPATLTSISVTLPAPNTISFWTEGLYKNSTNVVVAIEGVVYPESPWIQDRIITTESLTLTKNGFTTSINRWSSISNITFRGVPTGVTVTGYAFPFQTPGVLDFQRPYTNWNSRDTFYDRYWSLNNKLLTENYSGDYSGLQPFNTYLTTMPLNDIAVEPYAYGILGLSDIEVLYADRREPFPAQLNTSILTADPCYALDVNYDLTMVGNTRSVWLSGIPGAASASIFQYRYSVVTPSGNNYAINTNTGALLPFTQTNGWFSGAPIAIKVPLTQTGTYVFTLECIDTSVTTTSDSRPFLAAGFQPLNSLLLNSITSTPKGICYDSWGDLWIWDGEQAIPVKLTYTGYVLDTISNTIYLTQAPDTYISINGVVIPYSSTPVNSTSYVDVVGLLIGETRLPQETTPRYLRRLEAIAQAKSNHTYQGTIEQVNATLGFQPSTYIQITSTDPTSLVSLNLAGIVLTNSTESLTVPILTMAVDGMWEWQMLSQVVAGINSSLTFRATLETSDGPALQLARNSNTFLATNEAITAQSQVLENLQYIQGSGILSDSTITFNVTDGTITLNKAPSNGLTFTYQYSLMPFDLVGSPIACIGLTDPGFATAAVQSNGGLAYQVREYIQAIMSIDQSYWGQ